MRITMACLGKDHGQCRGQFPNGLPCECPIENCGHGTRRDPRNTLLDPRPGRVLTDAMVRNAAAKAGR